VGNEKRLKDFRRLIYAEEGIFAVDKIYADYSDGGYVGEQYNVLF
jgi:hypothetical protein